MTSIQDDRGYNQGFKPSKALQVRTERRCEYMISKMNFEKKVRILEIGCGTGELSYLLAKKTGSHVLGIDLCKTFIQCAKKKYLLNNLQYEILDFNHSESLFNIMKNNKFDYIVGNGILHHLYYNIYESLKSIYYLLNNNGRIVFLEPNIFNPYCYLIFNLFPFRKLAKLEPEEMAFSKRYITKKLVEAGFNNIEVEYKDFLLPGTPSFLINPVITIGGIAEKVPFFNKISQSIYISASKL